LRSFHLKPARNRRAAGLADHPDMQTTDRLTAAFGALAATFAIVWSIAALAYPQETQPAADLAARSADVRG